MWWLPVFVVLAIIGAGYAASILILTAVYVATRVATRSRRYRDTWTVVDLTPQAMPRDEH